MKCHTYPLLTLFAALLLPVLGGCGGKKLYEVSGTVTYNGEPVPAGMIYFNPVAGNDGAPQGRAKIENGTYKTSVGGAGVSGGAYRARINGFDGKSANDLPLGQPLFSDYEQVVELPRSDATQDFVVEIAPGGKGPKRGMPVPD